MNGLLLGLYSRLRHGDRSNVCRLDLERSCFRLLLLNGRRCSESRRYEVGLVSYASTIIEFLQVPAFATAPFVTGGSGDGAAAEAAGEGDDVAG